MKSLPLEQKNNLHFSRERSPLQWGVVYIWADMVKRKKRLRRRIASLEKQIELHRDKREVAVEEGDLYLAEYYRKEIEAKEADKKREIWQLNRKER